METSKSNKAAFQANLYIITALTNMHVGSGKNNYGMIDNLIQRDVLTQYPTINSSSLKGAFREYFGVLLNSRKAPLINYVFGADTKEDEKSRAGEYKFFNGQLLSIPLRSNNRPFYNATSPGIIQEFLHQLSTFGIKLAEAGELKAFGELLGDKKAIHFESGQTSEVVIEDLDIIAEAGTSSALEIISKYIGSHPVLVSDKVLMTLTNDEHLPVLARNNLENGVSQNLWYEQILPRQSRFFTMVLNPSEGKHLSEFNQIIEAQPVQIGGNASIGYGFSKVKNFSVLQLEKTTV